VAHLGLIIIITVMFLPFVLPPDPPARPPRSPMFKSKAEP
jgi:hypothetical protein